MTIAEENCRIYDLQTGRDMNRVGSAIGYWGPRYKSHIPMGPCQYIMHIKSIFYFYNAVVIYVHCM